MSWFDQNAPTGISDPNPALLPYTPPTGGINPDGMYSGTDAPVQAGTNGPSTPAPPGGAIPMGTTWNESSFTSQFGRPSNPRELLAIESQLNAAGIKVLRNAEGTAGKIQLPNGQIVDVINAAGDWMRTGGAKGGGFYWGDGGERGTSTGNFQYGTYTGGGQYPLASVMGVGLMQPWTTPFAGGPNFKAPTDVTQQNDPGWQFRMREGLKAIERSAASKGTLLTGGTLKDLNSWAQNTASNEYGNVYNRAASEWDRNYNRALGEYQMAYGIYGNNQNNQFGRLNALSQSGLTAAGGVNANNSSYGGNAANTLENMGNVNAAGIVGGANAYANLPGQIVNSVGTLANYYVRRPTTDYRYGQPYNGYYGTPVPLDPALGGGYG